MGNRDAPDKAALIDLIELVLHAAASDDEVLELQNRLLNNAEDRETYLHYLNLHSALKRRLAYDVDDEVSFVPGDEQVSTTAWQKTKSRFAVCAWASITAAAMLVAAIVYFQLPSWSKTDDMLVFFRRLKNDPVVTNWKTQIHIINTDGTGLHALTDDTHTDFNQTWTRDGNNTPIWNRKHPDRVSFQVMASKVGNKPGQEIALTDKSYHTWAYSCLIDGRILVQCAHPEHGYGYFLMTPNPGSEPKFERIDCELAKEGVLDRISISPSETRVCFEYQKGFQYKDAGRTLFIADFDAEKPSITNAKAFANEEGANRWFAYPRWSKDEKVIVYHASPSLYIYRLEEGSTAQVSTQEGADYRYPHMEATPKDGRLRQAVRLRIYLSRRQASQSKSRRRAARVPGGLSHGRAGSVDLRPDAPERECTRPSSQTGPNSRSAGDRNVYLDR